MKITVILGSPHKKGTTALLAENFVKGAQAAGNDVFVFDAAHSDITGCIGCDYCRRNGQCSKDDDAKELNKEVVNSDLIAFVTPLYYYGMSAQLKAAIDRFYAVNDDIKDKGIKAVLLAASADDEEGNDALKHHYDCICGYLGLEDMGKVIATECETVNDVKGTRYLEDAFELGASLNSVGIH